MGTETLGESPARLPWQACPSTPVKNMKRNASSMQESSDFPQPSPSQKRLKLIEAAMAGEGFSDHSGSSITSPNATVNNARNISAFQPSVSVGLNVNQTPAFPQTPTRSATTLPSCSSPEPFSQQSSASTTKDGSMAWSGEITPELIEDMVKVLSKLPDYIRKLDRKRIATEKSLEARKNKVQYLEDEIKRLKDRQKELEFIIDGEHK